MRIWCACLAAAALSGCAPVVLEESGASDSGTGPFTTGSGSYASDTDSGTGTAGSDGSADTGDELVCDELPSAVPCMTSACRSIEAVWRRCSGATLRFEIRADGDLLLIPGREILRIKSDGTENMIGSFSGELMPHLLPQGTGYALRMQATQARREDTLDLHDSSGRFVVRHVISPAANPNGGIWIWCDTLFSPEPGRVLLVEGYLGNDGCFQEHLRLVAPDGSDVAVIPAGEIPSGHGASNAQGFYLRKFSPGSADEVALLGNDGIVEWTLPIWGHDLTSAWTTDDVAFWGEDDVAHHVREGQILGLGPAVDVRPRLDISQDGTYMAAAHAGEQLALFEHGVELWTKPIADSIGRVSVSDRGETLLLTLDEKIELFDKGGNLVWVLPFDVGSRIGFVPGGDAFVVRRGYGRHELTYYRIIR